jgi:2-polyprenyl-6-methoxyphenol hydroxylase-like FAD-dependent oxidoreductase
VHEELEPLLSDYQILNLFNSQGEHLLTHPLTGYAIRDGGYGGNRGQLSLVFYKYALSLGLDIRLGSRITEYFESETGAGVIVDGERISADCVLACDGVHSKARGFITGSTGAPHSTGYAIYRAWFDAKDVKNDPEFAWAFEGPGDKFEVYIGPHVHCIIGTGRQRQDMVWTCTHLVVLKFLINAEPRRIHMISPSRGRSLVKLKML